MKTTTTTESTTSTGTAAATTRRRRPSEERGRVDHGWLDARHTFSFGSYQDPDWMGFRSLRVINEDTISAGMGFGEHGHRDMEIITYPISGAVRHRDSLGHEEDIVPGMVQHMSAGSGIRHSEFNPLLEETRLLQIWIEPRERGMEPAHRSRRFAVHEEHGRLHLLASPGAEDGSLRIGQDAWMHAGVFEGGATFEHPMTHTAHAWVQVVRGRLRVDGIELSAGDGLALSGIRSLDMEFEDESEVLVFELA